LTVLVAWRKGIKLESLKNALSKRYSIQKKYLRNDFLDFNEEVLEGSFGLRELEDNSVKDCGGVFVESV